LLVVALSALAFPLPETVNCGPRRRSASN